MRSSGRAAPRRAFIPPDETALIKYQIELVARPHVVKAGLQRLCDNFEVGLYLSDVGPFRNTIVGLAFTGETIVRRWAYKALAHIGAKPDIATLSDRMRNEPDPENLTWIMSAIFSLSREVTVLDLCRETGVPYSDGLALSSLLYGEKALMRIGTDLPKVNVDKADALTLQWCALLAGYGKAPPNLLHPRVENKTLLGTLNEHPSSEVAEYSVWALWKSPSFSIEDLKIPRHKLLGPPENVRRWINRLVVKNPKFLARNLDLFDDLCDNDGLKAREGLALGIRDVHLPELEKRVLQWFGKEPDAGLRELILEHLALSDSGDTSLFELLRDAYTRAEVGGSLRRRLRAAVAGRGGELFQAFNRVDAASFMMAGSAPLFGYGQPTIGALTVNNNNTINVAGDLNAQNVSGAISSRLRTNPSNN
jgi:hypothetical protein